MKLFLLLCCYTLPLGAFTVFVGELQKGATRLEVDRKTTVGDFLEVVRDAGFDSRTLSLKNRALITFDHTVPLGELNVKEGTWLFAKAAHSPRGFLRERLAQVIYSDKDNPGFIEEVSKEFATPEDFGAFLSSVRAGEEDGSKNVVFLAARKGNLKSIRALQGQLDDEHFRALLLEKTPQGRTVLHAAARATKNAPELIRYILQLAPELRNMMNQFGCKAIDAALMYDLRDPERIAALLGFESAGEPEFKVIKVDYSEGCKPKA